ncbi:serine hydrolase [Spongiimicrobium salis]|uniref:serine hydrolase n=1 Tax=Spongiimicrobium salis TaxID=1667022 RepID=UPI00374DAF0E
MQGPQIFSIRKLKIGIQIAMLFFGVATPIFGQLTLKGYVMSENNKAPLAYVNIGVLNSSFGTISNSDGSFSIEIPASHSEENLLFSAIGYQKKAIAITSFSRVTEIMVYLAEKEIVLDEVVLTASKRKEKLKRSWLGNRKKNLFVQGKMMVDSATAGGAMALLIEKKEDLSFINEARLFISRNTEPKFKVRVRFLKVDASNNNLPGEDILTESVVVESDMRRGWLKFDLSPYKLKIHEASFFLMFEWILEDEDRINLFRKLHEYVELNPDKIKRDTVVVDGEKVPTAGLSTGAPIPMIIFGDTSTKSDLKNYKCYSRENSFGEWRRETSIISAKVLMSNQASKNLPALEDDALITNKGTSESEETLDAKIEKWGKQFKEKYNVLGMQLAISSKKNMVFSGGFGYADAENQKKVDPQTRFRIASVTKPITSAAMIKLAAAGKLDLDTDVRTYVPSFPEKKYTLTPRQLAGHLGGIRDYYGISWDELFNNPHFETVTAAISIFKNDSLIAKPGDRFLYSSYGYTLLGAAIEGASGEPYLEYMQRAIWKPLRMSNTYGDVADSTLVHKSKFYYTNEEEAKPYDLSYSHASGGLISTTEDLLKFGNAFLYGDFFDSRLKDKLFETQYEIDQKPTNYGLGWYIGKDSNNRRIWYHVGQLPSSGAVLILYPDEGAIVALLTNMPILVNSEDGLPEDVLQLGNILFEN